jgi:hypothetical protein
VLVAAGCGVYPPKRAGQGPVGEGRKGSERLCHGCDSEARGRVLPLAYQPAFLLHQKLTSTPSTLATISPQRGRMDDAAAPSSRKRWRCSVSCCMEATSSARWWDHNPYGCGMIASSRGFRSSCPKATFPFGYADATAAVWHDTPHLLITDARTQGHWYASGYRYSDQVCSRRRRIISASSNSSRIARDWSANT